jgi:hypothetical protein
MCTSVSRKQYYIRLMDGQTGCHFWDLSIGARRFSGKASFLSAARRLHLLVPRQDCAPDDPSSKHHGEKEKQPRRPRARRRRRRAVAAPPPARTAGAAMTTTTQQRRLLLPPLPPHRDPDPPNPPRTAPRSERRAAEMMEADRAGRTPLHSGRLLRGAIGAVRHGGTTTVTATATTTTTGAAGSRFHIARLCSLFRRRGGGWMLHAHPTPKQGATRMSSGRAASFCTSRSFPGRSTRCGASTCATTRTTRTTVASCALATLSGTIRTVGRTSRPKRIDWRPPARPSSSATEKEEKEEEDARWNVRRRDRGKKCSRSQRDRHASPPSGRATAAKSAARLTAFFWGSERSLAARAGFTLRGPHWIDRLPRRSQGYSALERARDDDSEKAILTMDFLCLFFDRGRRLLGSTQAQLVRQTTICRSRLLTHPAAPLASKQTSKYVGLFFLLMQS